MHFRRFANLWILVLVAAGLLLAPLASAFAGAMPTASAAAMPTASDDHAMADDMPCCPDQTKQRTCDGCPFLALCMLSISLPVPDGTTSLIVRDPQRSRFMAHDDRLLDGLSAKPPDHPPRANV
ncbi:MULTISPECIES: hypothetical protein [unclassified Bradyrhizobium]|uniref:hypothetical protein n=1 Tax=unclassified Bradyrhizobium TaxID=2631580 RepID=UPI0024798054|nr:MULTISPECIES: hypothetical protein [unclassified Bradyrhizobium]WGS23305.1 hypothetical protein MTX22_17745 [Bradyrhizobium sp. ISRA463]WGS30315.1 hypothetical protein MTX19_15470 [Bradyrhizobium sp. ISRA464]